MGKLVKPVNWVTQVNTSNLQTGYIVNPIGINNLFFFLNYYLFNYIITKIDDCKIEHQTNT